MTVRYKDCIYNITYNPSDGKRMREPEDAGGSLLKQGYTIQRIKMPRRIAKERKEAAEDVPIAKQYAEDRLAEAETIGKQTTTFTKDGTGRTDGKSHAKRRREHAMTKAAKTKAEDRKSAAENRLNAADSKIKEAINEAERFSGTTTDSIVQKALHSGEGDTEDRTNMITIAQSIDEDETTMFMTNQPRGSESYTDETERKDAVQDDEPW
jgi:hypothetical protein